MENETDDTDDFTAPLWFAETFVGIAASLAILLVCLAVLFASRGAP